jgi:adenylate kinase family enzyme
MVGAVSSGKSTLSRKISNILDIPYQALDEVVHIPDKTQPWGNRKRQVEERDAIFHTFVQQSRWIIEDTGRPCFKEGFRLANMIVLLDISSKVRKYRIIKRWIKQRLGHEKCIYRPHIKMLIGMFKWSRDYDTGKDNLKERLSPYHEKVITLRNNKDINTFLTQISKKVIKQTKTI